jgi:WD40 repeat protein
MTKETTYPGISWNEGSYIVDTAFSAETGVFALGLGDGRVALRLIDKPETAVCPPVQAHQGGLTALAAAPDGKSFISIGEDGRVARITATGSVEEIHRIDRAWLEQLAVHESGLIAVAYKKNVVLLDGSGKTKAVFSDHSSTVQGICFDPKGKRLAATHYNGISLWWVNGEAGQKPEVKAWKGSHLGIRWSLNGKYILTSMQENNLHGWRLPDFADFAMSGYAVKPRSFDWTADGRWLATSGSPGIICWDCGGKGPMGKPPTVLGEACADTTIRVACHPELPLIAAGTLQGVIYLARFDDENLVWLKIVDAGEVTALRWSEDGRLLIAGADNGMVHAWVFAA